MRSGRLRSQEDEVICQLALIERIDLSGVTDFQVSRAEVKRVASISRSNLATMVATANQESHVFVLWLQYPESISMKQFEVNEDAAGIIVE